MSDILSGLEPVRVFHYFEEICAIPHGSGNEKAISDYCVAFAKSHDLWVRQDEANNVIIRKPGLLQVMRLLRLYAFRVIWIGMQKKTAMWI